MKIYVGDLIQYESERITLKEIRQLLESEQRSAIVFANISINSRQIDFVIALDGLILIIEAKGYTRPVRGGENGHWQVQMASGDWKDFPNPYVQARDASHTVRDAMNSFCGTEVPYPKAALVFVPEIPRTSRPYPGDFKVLVIGQNGLRTAFQEQGNNPWSAKRWMEFADHLRLIPVSTIEAAFDTVLTEAEQGLRRYTAMFCRTYKLEEPLVPFTCWSSGEEISSDDIMQMICEERVDLLLQGPTGCGKSILATSSGIAFNQRVGIAITVQVKEYAGRLKTVLDREVGLLAAPSAAQLLSDARRLNRPILFIVDGYNECAEETQSSLTRGIAALARKYEASILITSQVSLVSANLLNLRNIDVPPPTMETKLSIAKHASRDKVLSEEVEHLLRVISSGLEAKLAGEVGSSVRRGNSRYALFDAFARKRLGESAGDCIRTLAQIAAWLFDRFAFSLSGRDLGRLVDDEGISHALLRLMQEKGVTCAARG